jgi:hypothetical protein
MLAMPGFQISTAGWAEHMASKSTTPLLRTQITSWKTSQVAGGEHENEGQVCRREGSQGEINQCLTCFSLGAFDDSWHWVKC